MKPKSYLFYDGMIEGDRFAENLKNKPEHLRD
jgi:hypothetical protein